MSTDNTIIPLQGILTPNDVEDIRRLSRLKDTRIGDIAKKYGVDIDHVRYIRDRADRKSSTAPHSLEVSSPVPGPKYKLLPRNINGLEKHKSYTRLL